MADEPSRLLTGSIYYKGTYMPIEEYRDMIFARSLYNLDNEYENTNRFSLRNKGEVASSISTVLNVIPQYNRMQVNTNIIGNAYDAFRDEGSALAKIGIIMLGKQLAYNSAANLATKYIPSLNIGKALKGGKLFTKNVNNTITVEDKEGDDYTFGDKVASFGSNFLGVDTYNIFGNANPFSKNPTNDDRIKNTGTAQLTKFYTAVNLNIYKPDGSVFKEYADAAGVKIETSRVSVIGNISTFTFGDERYRPYLDFKIKPEAVVAANNAIDVSYSGNSDTTQGYAPTQDYVEDNFGTTSNNIKNTDIYNDVLSVSNFSLKDNNLVWGRDDVGIYAMPEINNLRGDEDKGDFADGYFGEANIKSGLLDYTKNLLNATSGHLIDITRKAFKKNGNIVGFNGSPLWEGNDTTYSRGSGNDGKTGVRDHTILDPYGSDETSLEGTTGFAKSIRFKGNILYNGNHSGNQDSVVYKTVLPRIHPTKKDGIINNKNMMLSLENLAIGTVKRDKYGVIDDEYGTPIPLSEVGNFGGRLMWFPPYNMEVNEVASAKYESTVMVGRNEPIYNYQNSERSAVLSFSLIVDYPEQLRNYMAETSNDDKNKAIADFFAFGGDPLPDEYQIEVIEEKIDILRGNIPQIEGPVEQAEPPQNNTQDVSIYFPNDMPTADKVNSVINSMYNDYNYEITESIPSKDDGNSFGLNRLLYYSTGLTTYPLPYIDQYTAIGDTDDLGISLLNKNLKDVYSNAEFRKYYNITITGEASKLYLISESEQEYNEALGNRRIAAAKYLVEQKLIAMFGAGAANEIIQNNIKVVSSSGSEGNSDAGADAKNMHTETVKMERSATISIRRNSLPVEKKVQKVNVKQEQDIAKIKKEIQALEFQLAVARKNIKENIFKERNKSILNSFESVSGNQYYPAFHSQTPEDFHRRLTFLQQCTRQGAAKRYDVVDENGILRAKNSVFGKQPICILRVGDFFHTKVIIESVTIDYADTTWDMNPEGFGMQPMMANVTLQLKLMGGQSLKGPIDALQNAVSFNYYANSSFTDRGMYARPSSEADKQSSYIKGIVTEKNKNLNAAYDALIDKTTEGDK